MLAKIRHTSNRKTHGDITENNNSDLLCFWQTLQHLGDVVEGNKTDGAATKTLETRLSQVYGQQMGEVDFSQECPT